MNTTFKVLLGMGLGIIAGLILNLTGLNAEGSWANSYLTDGLFKVVGSMFVNALKMLVVPLVFFSLVCGVCGIGDIKLLGRIGSKSFVLYLVTTALAIATALVIATGFGIGEGMNAESSANFAGKDSPPLSTVLINIIPSNPISAMAQGDMLPVIFFSIMFGVSILMVGKKATVVSDFIETLNDIMMKMVTIIMEVAPYAVFCLIARAIADLGMDLLAQLLGYVLVLIGVLLFHLFVTLQVILKVLSGLSPVTFMKKMRNTQVFAFQCDDSCDLARGNKTSGREKLSGVFYCAVWCDHQHGWHRHHARCGDGLYCQYLQRRTWHDGLPNRDIDVCIGIDWYGRRARCWFDHAVDGVLTSGFANRRYWFDSGCGSLVRHDPNGG